ncbi:MAG: MBL fold metallo-hydrolase [Lachnospiraceae bacterium]|nr:MBL fold metallo-hydrolase [Lachnospiraceae bacterium]
MKEELIVLGTGNATVTRCFNTCFIIQDEKERYFMIDTGGGNGILTQLEKAGISYNDIHHIFITHEHTDHMLGVIWLLRVISASMGSGKYEGDLKIYCHSDLMEMIRTIAGLMVRIQYPKMVDKRIFFIPVEDGEEKEILDYKVKFFDIHSDKAKQFGFTTVLNNQKKLTCCGDEPYQDHCYEYAAGSDWLLHEAFCLYDQRDIFKPYEKFHSTAKDAAELAASLEIKNLIMWHTEDKNIKKRKSLYKKEGRKYFKGGLYVPYDLERISL